MIPVPTLVPCFTLKVALGQPLELGQGRAGKRRIIPIIGGTAEGDLSGKVLNLGADWQTIYADGTAHLDTRYAIETDDQAVIEIVNIGSRHGPASVMAQLAAGEPVDPSQYYMRTAARLETGHPAYQWVNHMIFICAAIRHAAAVDITYYKVV